MAEYIGDFKQNVVIVYTFNTIGISSNPVRMSNVNFGVKRESDNAITDAGLTFDENIDEIVGAHRVTIDMSSDTVFYKNSEDFFVFCLFGRAQDTSLTGRVIVRWSVKNRFPQM